MLWVLRDQHSLLLPPPTSITIAGGVVLVQFHQMGAGTGGAIVVDEAEMRATAFSSIGLTRVGS